MARYAILFFALLTLSVSIIACKNEKDADAKGANKPKGLNAEVYVANARSFNSTYAASGSLLANEEIDLHPEISGRVTAISFKEGSKVKQGQLLIQLYDGEIKAQLQKLKSQKQLQLNTLNRQKELVNIGGISKQDYETTQTQVQSIDADIAFAEAQLHSMRIVAPFSGNIGIRNISLGAVISPATVIATLKQTEQLKMDFTLPQQYLKSVSIGKTVFFSVTGNPDTLTGKITAIDPGADANTRTVKVRAIVPNPGNQLVAGSYADVIIPLTSRNDAILIPSQAIIPTTKDKKVALVKNGKAEMVTVTLGQRTDNQVEIIQGINSGDTVILTGLMQTKPGMDVKITKVRS